MSDQAESSRLAPPMTPPPFPAIPEDSSSEAIRWAASDECSSSTPDTELLSLWLSNYTALPQPEAEEEPLADVPTVLNFDLESSFPDLVEWNTTSTAVTHAPIVTQPLWMQLHNSGEGEADDLSRLALGIQSPKASILPLSLGIQFPEASVSPLALGIQPSPASFEIRSPEDPMSPLALGVQPPPASSGSEAPRATILQLELGLQPPPASFGTQSPQSSVGMQPAQASIPPVALGTGSCILPPTRGIQFHDASTSPLNLPLSLGSQSPQVSFGIQSAPSPFLSLPPIPCTLSMASPLRDLQWIPCTLPMAPPSWTFLPSPSPVRGRRSWSEFPSTPSPARPQLLRLLPHSASTGASSPSSHLSHEPHYFFSAPNSGCQQHVPVEHAPATFSTLNAEANFLAGFVPAGRLSWLQGIAPRRHSTPNQPWMINNDQDMKLPIPQRPRFLLPAAAATMPASSVSLANFGSSVGNTPSSNARGDTPVGDYQRVQTQESRRPSRKRSKLAVRTR